MKPNLTNKKLLFIHIPKTGGTSILSKINQDMWEKVIYAGHDPFHVLELNNNIENSYSFCVVRNPYTRTFSYYNHFKKVNNLECSFLDFLYFIKTKYYFEKTPMIVYPQSFYVYNGKGFIVIDKIYRYENFLEIEEDLNIKFDKLNIGNYTQNEYKKTYENDEVINLVQELFSVDFINFNYSLDDI